MTGEILLLAVAAVVILGSSFLFGYYCAAKQVIAVASVSQPESQVVFDRSSEGDDGALSAEDLEEIDWEDSRDSDE